MELVIGRDAVMKHFDSINLMLSLGRDYWKEHFNYEDILVGLYAGYYQFWLVYQDDVPITGMWTQINQYPKKRTLMLIWLGGTKLPSVEALEKFSIHMDAYMQRVGCESAEAKCRPGFERVLAYLGFTKTAIYLERPLKVYPGQARKEGGE